MSNVSERDQLRNEIALLRRQLNILEQRAFGAQASEELPEGELYVVVCRIGEDRMAFQLESIEEAVLAAETMPIPEAPPWVPGFLNLHGEAIPILDVTARIEKRCRDMRLSDLFLIGRRQGRAFGLVVQEILDIVAVEKSALTAANQELPHAPYLLGVLTIDDWQIMLLSIVRLLDSSDIPKDIQ